MTGHSASMLAAHTLDLGVATDDRAGAEGSVPTLEEIYDQWFDFVWRSTRRMGVAEASIDDVVQEVFLVAHRRLQDFEGRSSVKTWLFGILLRTVKDHRRSQRRRGGLVPLPEGFADARSERCPAGMTEHRERVRLLHELLAGLDDDKRAAFVLAELEQMTANEIAEALDVNVNTVYSRIRAARKAFDAALARHDARARAAEASGGARR